MNKKIIPKKSKDTEWKEIDDQVLLLELKKSNFYLFNSLGSFIWKNMNGKKSLGRIHSGITEKFEVKSQRALTDLEKFVERLETLKLVELK